MTNFLSFLANVGLAWCFCVGVVVVGSWGRDLLTRGTNAVVDLVVRPPPGEGE